MSPGGSPAVAPAPLPTDSLSPQIVRGPQHRLLSPSAKVGAGITPPRFASPGESWAVNTRVRVTLGMPCPVPWCWAGSARSWVTSVASDTVPRLRVSPGQKEVVVEVQGAAAGHSYTLWLYRNLSHGTSGPGRVVTTVSMHPVP